MPNRATVAAFRAATENLPGARFHGPYRGRYGFRGVGVVVPHIGHLPALGSSLATADLCWLAMCIPHTDEMGYDIIVAWDAELFEAFEAPDDER